MIKPENVTMQISGKAALITGASRGIGAEIARHLSAAGASVFLVANDTEDALGAVASGCCAALTKGRAAVGRFDLVEQGVASAVLDSALAAFGRVDILVNNAAVRVRRPFGEFTAEEFDEVVGVNLRAPFLLGQVVAAHMKTLGGGRIINIASQMGSIAEQNLALYGLTKAALIHLTKSMAFELARDNIMVNAVSPGPTMTEYNVARTQEHPDYLKHKLSYLPSGRYCRPDEIAEVVTFLATTSATNIQGHDLIVDGGYVIH
jgi:NAD(P)-dependent dehydrogenase (short-subunit alcohol dehydrogenase family)